MNLLLQNNPELNSEIIGYGCFFMDCLALAQLETGRLLEVKEVNAIYDTAKRNNWVENNSVVCDPVALINFAVGFCGGHFRVGNTMVQESDGSEWKPGWFNGYKYMFQTNHSGAPGGVHYRLFDDHQTLIYDSYPGLNLGTWVERSYYQVY